MAQKDDLEAVRSIVAALDGFAAEEQERILRWTREKLKLPLGAAPSVEPVIVPQRTNLLTSATTQTGAAPGGGRDLKTFVAEKIPKSDVQFAATVAYYYRFEVSPDRRKDELTSEVLQEACRLASRVRLKNPGQTLRNAHGLGLLDKGSQAGSYSINSVGENLVAMTLPSDGRGKLQTKKFPKQRKVKGKKAASTRKTGKK
jgi:hypothetical protein